MREKTNNDQSGMNREGEKTTTCKVNTGCIANALMSLLLISATGHRWLPQMFVINKRADS